MSRPLTRAQTFENAAFIEALRPTGNIRLAAREQRGALPVSVRFTEGWSFPSEVQPLFPVPSCVLFARGERLPRRLPTTVMRYSGHLPMRDASPEDAAKCLRGVKEQWPADTGLSASPYRDKFRQGATLVPRRLVIVERLPAKSRLGANPLAPLVRGRTSTQDKKPWKFLDPLEGPVESELLRSVYLGESIAPYRVLGSVTGVIPWNPVKREVMDKDAAFSVGKRLLGDWLSKAEALWVEHGTGGMSLRDRWNYGRAISSQFPLGQYRIAYSKAGTQPAAVLIRDEKAVIDHKLYWLDVKTLAEGRYLETILNSETARAAAEHWQSEGQWGKRDFDKAVFNLPIPLYDSKNALHRDLATAAGRAETLAKKVELKDGEHFTRTRRRIRQALIDHGVAGRIEALVARLIGVAPAVSVATDEDDENGTMRTDIFGLATRQHDMFGAPQQSFDTPMTLEDMRAELREALSELEAADTFPWSPARATAQRVMFGEMTGKLPEQERDALMAAFNAELRRLRVIVD